MVTKMPPYIYDSNVSTRDRFQQVAIPMDNGTVATLRLGLTYELSSTEVARARQFIVLKSAAGPATAPERVVYLPVIGDLADGQVPLWSETAGAFVPGDAGAGGGGGHQIQDEGSNLTQRTVLNFTGAGVTAADSGGKTVVTVPGGAGVNTVLYDEDLGDWPSRPTNDTSVSYIWVGPTFPPVGGAGGFVSNLDVYIPDAEVPGGSSGAPDASDAVKGISSLSVAPASPTSPIAVGDNDPRMSAASDLATHAADTTAVHGIADTTALATSSSVTSAISTHAADATSVHGVTDFAGVPYVLKWNGTNYDPSSLRAVTERPREFRGPTNPSGLPGITLADYDVWTPTT